MRSDSGRLAIVIPAYKARFLRQALESIARQTDQRFRVYVGDDASPDNIGEICDDYRHRIDLVYTRFAENLGRESLVGHWNRCIELSAEPWIWLFCDDDVMEPRCVEMFHRTIEQEQDRFRVLRFNTLTIDDKGEIIRINPPHPLVETGAHFIYHRLKGERLSYVSEYIFSRESFLANKGMIDFPLGWCSDDASWLAFSDDQGILTIQGAQVLWRRGAYNITPSGAKHQEQRIDAACRFVHWLDRYLEDKATVNPYLTRDMIREAAGNWFIGQIRGVVPIRIANYAKIARAISRVTGANWRFSYPFLLGISLRFYRTGWKRTP